MSVSIIGVILAVTLLTLVAAAIGISAWRLHRARRTPDPTWKPTGFAYLKDDAGNKLPHDESKASLAARRAAEATEQQRAVATRRARPVRKRQRHKPARVVSLVEQKRKRQ